MEEAAARMIAAFAPESQLSNWGMSFQGADCNDRDGAFTVRLHHTPGPYQLFVHFPDPGDDAHELAIRVLTRFDEFPSHWPDVEWQAKPPVDAHGPHCAGHGWSWRRSG